MDSPPSNRTLWIARHAQRLDEIDPAWRDTTDRPYDPPLSEEGERQARALGERLRNEGIRHIVASPLLRTVTTAHAVADALDLTIRLEEGIFEWISPRWFSGQPEPLSREVLAERFPRVDAASGSLGALPRYPESGTELAARIDGVVKRLIESLDGDLLLVTHAAPLVTIARYLVRVVSEIRTDNGSLVRIERDGDGWRMTLAGEIEYQV